MKTLLPAATLCGLLLAAPSLSMAADAAAAQKLAKENDCFKCHAVDRTKKGPSLQKIAATLKAKEKDPVAAILKHLKSGARVKLEDGSEEDHKIIETDDQKAMRNLAEWILAQ